ncbi:hypothetical protein ACFL1B_04635 [Nanoarchaeota archaeon]
MAARKETEMETVSKELRLIRKELEAIRKNTNLDLSDNEAKDLLKKTIEKLRRKSSDGFSALDLYMETRLPYEQINEIMHQLEKEGFVRESDDEEYEC